MSKQKSYYIVQTPKGKFWGNAYERLNDIEYPDYGWFANFLAYKKEFKKRGWKIVKVKFTKK